MWMRLFGKEVNPFSVKSQLILFLGLLAASLAFIGKDALFVFSISLALISAVLIDAVFSYLKDKKLTISESAIISGLIIGFVLASDSRWWVIFAASLLAISSKYLVRINKKHIFNPAAFGIFLSILLFKADTQWKGAYLWYIIIPAGTYFIYKIRKVELVASYLVAALGLFAIQALLQNTPLGNIFGYLSYFYIFIMLIEPKTTPLKPKGKIIFGISVAVVIFILTEAGISFDVELAALLLLNMFVPFLNKL
jgi:Na+-translocating ferredoxin:NAD+ oxidoreductase RnfD subunit